MSTEPAATAASSTAAPKKQNRTVLEECEEALAQSMLVFLLADLRLLSATGRVETKYETIAIASDPPTRSTATDLAGLDPDNTHDSMVHNQKEGLSPAQIMAVVLLELTKTVEARRKREAASGLMNKGFEEEDLQAWRYDKKAGRLMIQAGGDDMSSLLMAYADMLGADLKTQPPHVEKRYSMLNLNPQTLQAIQEDAGADEAEPAEDEPLGLQAMKAAEKVAEEQIQRPLRRANARRQSIMQTDEARANEHFGELTDALYRQGVSSRGLRTSLAQSLGRQSRTFTAEELHDFIQNAVDSRVYGKLDFLADLFKDGTVSKFMAESKSRIVWMNDWYPLKDLTYAIAVNREIKRVLIVFRGCITTEDWSRAIQSRNLIEVPNPIEEDYEGKTDTLNMGAGFYQYLFRVRKDTGTKKYDEIANLAYKYGKERIGDDFELVLNGHSLGGALSTLFSFYASADKRFTRNGPVKCFNFGSPYVGGNRFMRAFLHQEQRHMLMLARFFNHNDVISHLPPNVQVTKHGGMFRPVGIGVRVPSVPYGICGHIHSWKPRLEHVKEESFCRSYWRALRNNFVLKFPFPPWRCSRMHTLTELQERLMYGKLTGAGDDFDLLQKPIEELYDIVVGTSYEKDTGKQRMKSSGGIGGDQYVLFVEPPVV